MSVSQYQWATLFGSFFSSIIFFLKSLLIFLVLSCFESEWFRFYNSHSYCLCPLLLWDTNFAVAKFTTNPPSKLHHCFQLHPFPSVNKASSKPQLSMPMSLSPPILRNRLSHCQLYCCHQLDHHRRQLNHHHLCLSSINKASPKPQLHCCHLIVLPLLEIDFTTTSLTITSLPLSSPLIY